MELPNDQHGTQILMATPTSCYYYIQQLTIECTSTVPSHGKL